jgi:hypothetical protein
MIIDSITTAEDCAWQCLLENDEVDCQAFEYHEADESCVLLSNSSTFGGVETEFNHNWYFYELGELI